jgi:lysophospholipase L1-like esterase
MWDGLEKAFELPTSQAVLKRGFGGSRLQDCAERVDQLVLPYKPRLVVVYAGDNDLAEGRTPQQVMESFASFVEAVRSSLPDTRVAYVSIKPSPLRSNLMASIRETNALIAGYARTAPNLDYIDIFSRMLDDAGRPRADLFQPDALHLNATGYALWRSVIGPHLQANGVTATATATSVTEPAMVSAAATSIKAPPAGR